MEAAMPTTVTTKAKRLAIVQAYGCHRIEDCMDGFYYSLRHLAKLDQANPDGWHELKYEEAELREAIERTLRIIRERDGVKYFEEVAADLIAAIAFNVKYRAGPKALRRVTDRSSVGVIT
jgi:hypothetical protein